MTENRFGVLQINESLARSGGAESYIYDLSQLLLQREVSVRMCSGRNEVFDNPQISQTIRGVHKAKGQEETKEVVSKIRTILTSNGLNIIHLHNVDNPALISSLAGEFPIVRTIHDSRAICPGEYRIDNSGNLCTIPLGEHCVTCCGGEKSLLDIQARQKSLEQFDSLDLVITPSQYTKSQLMINGITESKVRVIPLFAPLDLDPNTSKDEGHSTNFIFIGRVTRSKGLREALVALSKSDRHSQMVVCGEGPDLEQCRSLADRLSLQGRVNFIGWKSGTEKSRYLASADVMILPSMGPESFGLVGLEAMFYRKPVIAFDAGGISEWLKSKQNGFLVERGNTEQMAQAMSLLMGSKNFREELGNNGKTILDTDFSPEKHLSTIMQVYSSVRR